MKSLIRERHPAMRMNAIQTNITDHYQLPTFLDTKTFWNYIRCMETYVTDVKSNMDQIDILRLVQDQLRGDPHFDRAASHLQNKIDKHREGNRSFLERYMLCNLVITVMDLYNSKEK